MYTLKFVIITLIGSIILGFAFKKKLQSLFLKKPKKANGPDRIWETKAIAAELFINKEKSFLPEQVTKIVEFEEKAKEALKLMEKAVSLDCVQWDKWEQERKNTPVAWFDPLKILQYGQDSMSKMRVKAQKQSLELEIPILEVKILINKLHLFFESLNYIKPEIKESLQFQERLARAMESDIAWMEARNGKKLTEWDEMGFCIVEDLLKKLKITELTERFMPRLQRLSS